ncbi:MAG: galactosyldiacylglycerol synthase [Chloroflexi bacterium]|jgi:1,2-diacylglycerol 3-beta-galactosyltransferase|uniref:Galactosyldiacylglycerol synthase n=1 Tax=Candidatus Thermofonsia Clade 3 bacterium TaxID=2364212 RepID=A0A2M8QB48_9CHLR|nr:glycosyltransferase [Candidatus Roseilinea sp. NK_OTU-006]PJF47015.1 MAG: galactosyldiacylglycerol synthase [Candidatus Thermofonsia Clade 3 bacterium]RMG64740.1 MAG: galactosyldiacylglycerol synthase [Chloroflexota bacterium]
MKKRIVLLYGNTGGGHRSAAQAIAQGIEILYPGAYDVQLVDGLRNVPFLINAFTETYPMWVNHARVLYALGFHASNNRRRIIALRNMLEPLSEKTADAIVKDHPADVYVSCHLLFNQSIPMALRRRNMQTPFIHVVTDLVSGHVAHYVTDADHLIVPTEEARAEAIKNLVPEEKISVTGQPIAPDFAQRVTHGATTRRALNLDERMTVLLIGGGDGMGRLEVTARQIALSGLPLQLIVVCGRNQTVKENLEFLNPRVPMRVFGFVNNIPELMGAADVIVTKAGPGTICEAFVAHLPIILYDAVPGQEEGNVDYVVNSGAGVWCPTPWAVLKQLKQWLADPAAMELARQASARLARPDSALEIARIVHRFAQLVPDPPMSR